MILQSHSRYDCLADFDHATGQYRLLSKAAVGGNPETKGWFDILSSEFVALYRTDWQLFLRIGEISLVFTDDVQIDVSGPSNRRQLTIKRGDETVSTITYAIDPLFAIEDDPAPTGEPEDFDFGLFLTNIAHHKARKNRIAAMTET